MTMNSPLCLAVFDLDGTIVDSQGLIVAGMQIAGETLSLPLPEPAAVRQIIGLPLITAIERLFPGSNKLVHEGLAEAYKDAIISRRRLGLAEEPLFADVQGTLEQLTRDGWLLGLATGKSHRGVVNSLAPHGLLGDFLTVQTADHGPGKPNPDMLFRAMVETGAEKSYTVMVGDTTYDMEMARNAGTFAVGVAWGYHNVKELRQAGAHAIVEDWVSLPKIIEALVEKEK